MNRIKKYFFILFITFITLVSCTTEKGSLKLEKIEAETSEIHFIREDSDTEHFFYSDILKKEQKINFTAYKGTFFTDSSDITDSAIIGMSMTDETTLLTSDRKGNIIIYKKEGSKWDLTEKLKLTADEIISFDAFSADKSYICLYSGITDSIYFYPYIERPSLIFKLYTDDTSFDREITDIDMDKGYIYMLDTEKKVSIIDYREKMFETEMQLKSGIDLRSLSIKHESEEISLAALSRGSSDVYIFPMSERYLMIEDKGYIKSAGITSFNYGTHVLVSDNGEILYALESSLVNLSDYRKGEVTVYGKLKHDYPLDGGPEFLKVSAVEK